MVRAKGGARGAEFFFIEVKADGDGGEVARGRLLAHIVDGLDDVGEREGAARDAGGEKFEARRFEGNARRMPGGVGPRVARVHGTGVMEDPGSGTLHLTIPIRIDELPILPPSLGGDSHEGHTHPE